MNILNRILPVWSVRRTPSLDHGEEDALLNHALGFAQEWGDQWLKPTQERLHRAYPSLSQAELDRIDSVAQAAMKFGHELVYSMAEKEGKGIRKSVWLEALAALYPWVDRKNRRHLFSTGKYYVWKDGVG